MIKQRERINEPHCQFLKHNGKPCYHWAGKRLIINDLDHGEITTTKTISLCDTHYLFTVIDLAAQQTKGQIFG